MRYIYGPVHSRRLGLSLGISLTPHKVCTFDCIYCQLGQTAETATERREYVPAKDILAELASWLEGNPAQGLDYITLSGTGEPTLHSGLGELIQGIKKLTAVPVAVITNASLLPDPEVREELKAADLIVPSLDAVDQRVFQAIDRPGQGVSVDAVIAGLKALRGEFKGRIWLEVMLVRGVNDDLRHIRKLKKAIEAIRPDKVQLNSPVRATTFAGVLPVDKKKLEKIRGMLGDNCEIA